MQKKSSVLKVMFEASDKLSYCQGGVSSNKPIVFLMYMTVKRLRKIGQSHNALHNNLLYTPYLPTLLRVQLL